MAGDVVYLVVGKAEENTPEKTLVEYKNIATNHPGCLSSTLSQDVGAKDYRLTQEWESKSTFLAFHRMVPLPENVILNHYEATQFAAPGITKGPHHVWGKAERRDLTKTKGRLFFLSIEGRTKHALFNNTTDLQFDVQMRFPQQDMKPMPPRATQQAEQFKLTIFPGQTVPFVQGKWNGGYALSYSYGPVTDSRFLDENAKGIQQKVATEITQFKEFLVSKGVNIEQPGILESEDFDERAVNLCMAEGKNYVDLKWPPQQSSISRSWEGKRRVLAWMRPEDYLPEEYKGKIEHIVKDIECDDIDQGALGDCWFLAAVAACAESPEQLVVPIFRNNHRMRSNAGDYIAQHKRELAAGFFRVRLAKHGWWKWNIVDTFLPVQPLQEPGGPCFAKNKQEPNEMWVAILEKCYAKLHGSYVAISGGDPAVAMSDITGFPTISFDWKENEQLFEKILNYDENGRMIWLSTPGEDASDYMGGGATEAAREKASKYEDVGLGTGHAYTVLKAAKIDVERRGSTVTHRILQIRNPWGNSVEWNKAWSDNSKEWREYPEVLEHIKHKWDIATPEQMFQNDGSYWMAWQDCLQYFNGGGACLRNQYWQDIRYKTSFSDGSPEHIFKIKPTVKCQCIAFAVQHDRRGLHKDDPLREMCALRVEIVSQAPKKPMFDVIAQSNNGVFMYAHQVVAFEVGKEGEPVLLEEGVEYYVILRQHPGEQKQQVRNRENVVLCIQTSPGNRNQHCRGIAPLVVTPEVCKNSCFLSFCFL